MAPETLIGIDVGTTAVKAVLVTLDGRVLDGYAAAYPTSRPQPGWVEQDPDDWLAHAVAALGRFAAYDFGELRGIGLTGQVNTHVFADAGLRPVRPAIVWQDARAAVEAAAIDAGVAAAEKLAWFGAPMPIDASHALSRIAWVAAHEPETWARTAHVLAPKDWLLARLTGAIASDPIASVGLAGRDLGYVGCRRLPTRLRRWRRWRRACPVPACRSCSALWTPGRACSGSASWRTGRRCT
jgi:xylulokinase